MDPKRTIEQQIKVLRTILGVVERNGDSDEARESLARSIKGLESIPHSARVTFDRIVEHLPDEEAEVELLILKAHLLVEAALRDYVVFRLPDRRWFKKQNRMRASTLIGLARSLTTKSKDWDCIFTFVTELNGLRNKMAHRLSTDDLDAEVAALIKRSNTAFGLRDAQLTGILAHCLGTFTWSCAPQFQIPSPDEPRMEGM